MHLCQTSFSPTRLSWCSSCGTLRCALRVAVVLSCATPSVPPPLLPRSPFTILVTLHYRKDLHLSYGRRMGTVTAAILQRLRRISEGSCCPSLSLSLSFAGSPFRSVSTSTQAFPGQFIGLSIVIRCLNLFSCYSFPPLFFFSPSLSLPHTHRHTYRPSHHHHHHHRCWSKSADQKYWRRGEVRQTNVCVRARSVEGIERARCLRN